MNLLTFLLFCSKIGLQTTSFLDNKLVNFFGKGGTLTAILLNVSNWLFDANISKYLTIVISLVSLVYLMMKMYDQYLVTKKRKDEAKK